MTTKKMFIIKNILTTASLIQSDFYNNEIVRDTKALISLDYYQENDDTIKFIIITNKESYTTLDKKNVLKILAEELKKDVKKYQTFHKDKWELVPDFFVSISFEETTILK